MRVLLFGGSGQLGQEYVTRARDLSFEVISPALGEVDITEETQVRYLASQIKPDLVVNFAAYTAVDKAESEREAAFFINRDGSRHVAIAAKDLGKRLLHVSTDYVFSGEGNLLLDELSPTGPQSVYGESKLEGEKEIIKVLADQALIIRTSSLHGQYGANFVHTMLSLFDQKKTVNVVSDQIMSPTWAGFLAESILDLSRSNAGGVVHCSCKGEVSWFEFAKKIGELAFNPDEQPDIRPSLLKDLDRPAKRPQYSPFNVARLEKLLGRPALSWPKGLALHLKDIGRLKGKV